MQRGSSHLRNIATVPRVRFDAPEPITEPSGPGAFAEAMRELIADLSAVPGAEQLGCVYPANTAAAPAPARTRHLQLVR
jgi:hypothetical protein